jgi:hypothetical protein
MPRRRAHMARTLGTRQAGKVLLHMLATLITAPRPTSISAASACTHSYLAELMRMQLACIAIRTLSLQPRTLPSSNASAGEHGEPCIHAWEHGELAERGQLLLLAWQASRAASRHVQPSRRAVQRADRAERPALQLPSLTRWQARGCSRGTSVACCFIGFVEGRCGQSALGGRCEPK